MSRTIDYGNLMQHAMRALVRDVLRDVQANGLPGEHHFFITFDTNCPGVEIADWLRERYGADMTVVMQHWYDHLDVRENGFSVSLNFGDRPEPLVIPYEAIKTFVDPSVEFGLRFESHDAEDEDEDVDALIDTMDAEEEAPMVELEQEHHDAEVVSLDQFRK